MCADVEEDGAGAAEGQLDCGWGRHEQQIQGQGEAEVLLARWTGRRSLGLVRVVDELELERAVQQKEYFLPIGERLEMGICDPLTGTVKLLALLRK